MSDGSDTPAPLFEGPGDPHPALHRVTVQFASNCGNEYLYDDVTGAILPWGALEEATLRRELRDSLSEAHRRALGTADSAEATACAAQIQRWLVHLHAFARPPHPALATPAACEMRSLVWANCSELVLIVTENCNLSCRYCTYASGSYYYHRGPTGRSMRPSQAVSAVEWFLEGVGQHVARNPRKRYGLSFYGGEPLLNIAVIKHVLEFAEAQVPGLFFPVLNTNGLLLTPENVEVLREHRVHVAVSIDGPQPEHDRLRVDHGLTGSYGRIEANLIRIKREHPNYWRECLVSLSVYDPLSDVAAISRFFDDGASAIPRSAFVNAVGSHNTNYYGRFQPKDYELLSRRLHALKAEYMRREIAGDRVGSYMRNLVAAPMMLLFLRSRIHDAKSPFLPYTGCCIPGLRMAVSPDGLVNMCERVNGTYPIGDLTNGGLNYEVIARLIREYQREVLCNCSLCPITRLCGMCFSASEVCGGVKPPSGYCAGAVREAGKNLADYVSLMESSPDAQERFRSQTANVATERWLFQS